ncbi:MAG: hypothetical protein H8E55_21535 [Pelagibacterales bacterium]|nr:hypothetical protein [Pelagibacterales bacterium]
MGTDKRIAAAIALLEKHRPNILKKKRKKKQKSDMSIVVASTVGPVAERMVNDPEIKNLTLRKIFLKTIRTRYFNMVLDEYFKGPKRIEFDDISRKQYNTAKTLIQDISTIGMHKRFKLLERYCIWDLESLRAIFKVGYYPKKVVIRKRKYKKS